MDVPLRLFTTLLYDRRQHDEPKSVIRLYSGIQSDMHEHGHLLASIVVISLTQLLTTTDTIPLHIKLTVFHKRYIFP